MADESLKNAIRVQTSRIDATSLPKGLSQAFSQYLIQQGQDFGQVAGKANEAGVGAYDAQVQNDNQDEQIENHEQRISQAETTLLDHENRITQAEGDIDNLETRISSAESDIDNLQATATNHEQRIAANEQAINTIPTNYISKTSITLQSMASPLSVTTSYSVNGTKVVGARVTGFTAATGTALYGAFDANLSLPVGTAYSQTEVNNISVVLTQTRRRLKTIEDALRTHGLID